MAIHVHCGDIRHRDCNWCVSSVSSATCFVQRLSTAAVMQLHVLSPHLFDEIVLNSLILLYFAAFCSIGHMALCLLTLQARFRQVDLLFHQGIYWCTCLIELAWTFGTLSGQCVLPHAQLQQLSNVYLFRQGMQAA